MPFFREMPDNFVCLLFAVFIESWKLRPTTGMTMFAGTANCAYFEQVGETAPRGRCGSARVADTIRRAESSPEAIKHCPKE